MLKLGGENIIGLGADFDGIDESPFADVTSYTRVEELLRKNMGLSEDVIEKMLHTTAKELQQFRRISTVGASLAGAKYSRIKR